MGREHLPQLSLNEMTKIVVNQFKEYSASSVKYPNSGACYSRHLFLRLEFLAQFNQESHSAYIFTCGDNRALTPTHPLLKNNRSYVYHVAVALYDTEKSDDESQVMIVDPVIPEEILKLNDWIDDWSFEDTQLKVFAAKDKNLMLQYRNERRMELSPSCGGLGDFMKSIKAKRDHFMISQDDFNESYRLLQQGNAEYFQELKNRAKQDHNFTKVMALERYETKMQDNLKTRAVTLLQFLKAKNRLITRP